MTLGDYTRVNFVDTVTELDEVNMNNLDAKIDELDNFADAVPLDNLIATTDPTVNDDSGDGYGVGSSWANVTLDKFFVCVDATVGAAVWNDTAAAGGGVQESDFNAHTILQATSDDTPVPITIAEQRIIGRITAGNIKALTAAEVLTLIAVEAGADVTDAGNVGSTIFGASAKTTPVNADTLGITDSDASNALKKVTWANVKATLKTYFDTLYNLYSHPNHTGDVTSTGDGATVIGASAVDIAMLSASGTPSSSTYLRGDNTWATPAGGGSSIVNIFLPAEAAYLPVINPAELSEELGATVYAGHSHLKFDDTTSEHAVWRVSMPDYDGGNIVVTAYSKVSTTPSGAATLQYNILTIGLANSEAFDAAETVDTAVNISHSLNTSELLTDIMVASATIDPANVAADDLMVIELTRDVASDNLVGDGELVAISIEYTRA